MKDNISCSTTTLGLDNATDRQCLRLTNDQCDDKGCQASTFVVASFDAPASTVAFCFF